MNSVLTIGLAVVLLLTISSQCSDKASLENSNESRGFTISGKLQNNTSTYVYLSVLADQAFIVIDSATIHRDGSFQFKGDMAAPEIYQLFTTPENAMTVVADVQHMEIRADAIDPAGTYEVKGSPESLRIKSLMQAVAQNEKELSLVEKKFIASRQAGKTDSIFFYQQKYMDVQIEHTRQIKDFIRQNPDSFVAVYAAFSLIDPMEEDVFLDSMIVVFNKYIPGSKYVKMLNERKGMGGLAVGSHAPELTLDQPDGSALTLSSLRGKYVLIDFWASWCRPCREENPAMVKLYNEYKENGFEIMGVSLDESKNQWLAAIKKDGLPWRHVSDLKGTASPAAQAYNVEAIPKTVLLDRTGRILALDLRTDALKEKLSELFYGNRVHKDISK